MTRLAADGRKILLVRTLRSFAFGYLTVLFGVYMALLGYGPVQTGLLFTAAIAGSALFTIVSSAIADRVGRRRTACAMAALMIAGGMLFVATAEFPFLVVAAFIGTSPAVSDVGVLQVLEHAALPQTVSDRNRTAMFVAYSLLTNVGAAAGSLAAGGVVWVASATGDPIVGYRVFFALFSLIGLANLLVYLTMSERVELHSATESLRQVEPLHLRGVSAVILKLSGIQGLDAFAGGFILQSLIAYWFALRWSFTAPTLGALFFGTNLLSALSLTTAPWLARRFGLLKVAVLSQLAASVLIMLVPIAPTAILSVAAYLARMSISQMDVPTRQSYAMAVVGREERVATAGLMNVARGVTGALSPTLTGLAYASGAMSLPFFVGGGLKMSAQVVFYALFRHIRPAEEQRLFEQHLLPDAARDESLS